jgi:hypothetical protein
MNAHDLTCSFRLFDSEGTEEIATLLLSLKHSQSAQVKPCNHVSGDESTSTFSMLPVDSPSTVLENNDAKRSSRSKIVNVLTSHKCYKVVQLRGYTAVKVPSTLDCTVLDAKLFAGSSLVLPEDRDLVPSALFVVVAQLQICRLTQLDQVGCYKMREIGFVGVACKHCGGLPGFGRYFAQSARSLAQTTTSKTILEHISRKCSCTPSYIHDAVLKLQEIQRRQCLASGHRHYGSQKVFFERVWSRIHENVLPRVDNG